MVFDGPVLPANGASKMSEPLPFTKRYVLSSFAALIFAFPGCAGGGNGDGDGDSAGGSVGDGDGAGGSTGDGDGSGGSGDGDGDGGSLYAGECSPVGSQWAQFPETSDVPVDGSISSQEDFCPDRTDPDLDAAADTQEYFVEGGIAAGTSFALSWDTFVADASQSIQVWAVDDYCGNKTELLFEGTVSSGNNCVSVTPAAATEYLLVVATSGSPFATPEYMTYCPGGSCGG